MSLEYRFDHRRAVESQLVGRKRNLCWLYFICFILLQLGAVLWCYLNGYLMPLNAQGGAHALSLRGKLDEQALRLAQQVDAMTQLQVRLAATQRAEAIQVASNEVLRDKLMLAETALAESRERLLLYEEVLAPTVGRGLDIQYLAIKRLLIDADGKKLAHERHYQYHLILTNIRGAEALVSGQFNLTLQGKSQGKPQSLPLKALVLMARSGKQTPRADNTFSFKHYQGLEGVIELPDGFTPQRVIIELMPVAGKKVRRQYAWDTFAPVETTTTSKE